MTTIDDVTILFNVPYNLNNAMSIARFFSAAWNDSKIISDAKVCSGCSTLVVVKNNCDMCLHITYDKAKYLILINNLLDIKYDFIGTVGKYYIGLVEKLEFPFEVKNAVHPIIAKIKHAIDSQKEKANLPSLYLTYENCINVLTNASFALYEETEIESELKNNLLYLLKKTVSIAEYLKDDNELKYCTCFFDIHGGNVAVDNDGKYLPIDVLYISGA